MKTFLRYTSVLLLVAISLCACTGNKARTEEGIPIALSHASLLSMEHTDSFTLVTVKDPWHEGKTLATYVLVPHTSAIPHHIPEGILVRTPIQRATLTTSVHVALLAELGMQNSIAGITDAEFVVSPQVKALLSTQGGHIRPMGSSMQPNAELIRAAHCDAVFISPSKTPEADRSSVWDYPSLPVPTTWKLPPRQSGMDALLRHTLRMRRACRLALQPSGNGLRNACSKSQELPRTQT